MLFGIKLPQIAIWHGIRSREGEFYGFYCHAHLSVVGDMHCNKCRSSLLLILLHCYAPRP